MQSPEIFIYNNRFNLKGIVDQYSSFQGSRSLWEVGSCELHTSVTDSGAPELKIGSILYIDNKRAWVIRSIEMREDEKLTLVVRGEQVKGILSQRLVIPGKLGDTQYFGWDRYPAADSPDAPAESIMKYYANEHAISPEDPDRGFPGLLLEPDHQRGIKTRWSERFKPLDKTLGDIGEYTGSGWDIEVNPDSQAMTFKYLPESVQTVGSESPVIFSVEYDNIARITYKDSSEGLANIAYLGGAGTDENRLITSIPALDRATGFDRSETWYDCGSLNNIDDLVYEGSYRLDKMERKESFSGDILPGKTFSYLIDWDLGSIVTLRSTALGLESNKRVTTVKESWEATGYDISITFGKRQKNFLDVIKKREVVR